METRGAVKHVWQDQELIGILERILSALILLHDAEVEFSDGRGRVNLSLEIAALLQALRKLRAEQLLRPSKKSRLLH